MPTANYKAKRDALLKANEGGCKNTTYLDTVGVPTLGVGVSLVKRADTKETPGRDFALNRENLDEIAKELGNGKDEGDVVENLHFPYI